MENTHTVYLLHILHIISSPLPNLLPPFSPLTLSPPLPGCSLLSAGFDIQPASLLLCCNVLHGPYPCIFTLLPSPLSTSLPLTVLVHLTCSPALCAIVFYTLSQTFLSHKRAQKKLQVCVRLRVCPCASDLANLFGVFNLTEGKAVGQG